MDFSGFIAIRRRRHATGARGFTLIELMVVVVIIGVLATIAVPQIVERLRERRSSQAAQQSALMYRNARLRAQGRGLPVMARYNTSGGGFVVEEALPLGPADCTPRLSNTCAATNWAGVAGTDFRVVESFDPTQSYAGITATVNPLPYHQGSGNDG